MTDEGRFQWTWVEVTSRRNPLVRCGLNGSNRLLYLVGGSGQRWNLGCVSISTCEVSEASSWKKNGVNLHYVLDYALWAEFACRGPIVTKAEKGLSGLWCFTWYLLLVWVCIHDIFVYDLDLGSTYFLFSVCNVSTHTLRTRCLWKTE